MACLIVSLIATQWILAARLPIVADEAYYVFWATNPALGYFDHPPMIAWLLAIAPIRVVSIFCFLAGAGFLYRASRGVCGGAAHWTLLLLVAGLVSGVVLVSALSPSALAQLQLSGDQIQAIPAALLLLIASLLLA